jgi:hypothetical protein
VKTIHADIVGDSLARAHIDGSEITVNGSAPVLMLCRELVRRGLDPALPLEAYRGETLCLKVRCIAEGARLRVAAHGVGFQLATECTGAPPVRSNRAAVLRQPPPASALQHEGVQ